jgi:predicted aldo/keto reductase-like oxidoreductase
VTPLPRRALGRTGESLSVIGFGGILTMDETPAEAARVVAKAIEAFVRARRDGLARYLGFSARTEEAALAAMERFDFDTILFPLNRIAWHRGGFGPRAARPRRSGTRRATATALRCPRSRRSSRQRVSAAARGRARRAWAGTRGRTAARRRSP